jgi:hypothetical protein
MERNFKTAVNDISLLYLLPGCEQHVEVLLIMDNLLEHVRMLLLDKLIQRQRGCMMQETKPNRFFFQQIEQLFIQVVQSPDLVLPRYVP